MKRKLLAAVSLALSVGALLTGAREEEDELPRLTAQAEAGDAEAQEELAVRFRRGHGVPKDDAKAAEWAARAAVSGIAEASFTVGRRYLYGAGVEPNPEKAAELLEKAAELGHAEAQSILAVHYYRGDALPRDLSRAIKWCLPAAEQGDPAAQNNLALMYDEAGEAQLAFRWTRRTAEHNLPEALARLADFYYRGHGAPCDPALCTHYLTRAAELGHTASMVRLALLFLQNDAAAPAPPAALKWIPHAFRFYAPHALPLIRRLFPRLCRKCLTAQTRA